MLHLSLHSLVIEQVLGFYFLIMGIVFIARANYYRDVINDLQNHSALIVTIATFSLLLGIFLIVIHNIWIWRFEVIVTLIAWWITIKSLLWLSIPEKMCRFTQAVYNSGWAYYLISIVMAIIGILLLARGFSQFMV